MPYLPNGGFQADEGLGSLFQLGGGGGDLAAGALDALKAMLPFRSTLASRGPDKQDTPAYFSKDAPAPKGPNSVFDAGKLGDNPGFHLPSEAGDIFKAPLGPATEQPAPKPPADAKAEAPKLADFATSNGVNPDALKKIAEIESGNNPREVKGSYKGLFQLSDREFQKYNPGGNIMDSADNTAAATRKIAAEAATFENRFGRPATVLDAYMVHQQGEGGYAMHLKNPDQPAWKNMLATAEGRGKGDKGETWAKATIWGNMPKQYRRQFNSVADVTSADFVKVWAHRLGPEASKPIISPSQMAGA